MKLLAKLFAFDPSSMRVRTEIMAGITTFLTMSYILAVNPPMFGLLGDGMTAAASFTATALAAIIGTLVMALYAKLPFALAPGMGLNAFFVFSVCLGMGYAWQEALTAVLIEGVIFVILTLTNIREAIVNAIPASLKNAIGAGIGLFIAFIGLQNAGIVVSNDATMVSLGNITSGSALLAVIGIVIIGVMVVKNVKGALLIGILMTTIIGIPMGITDFQGIVSTPVSVAPIFCQFEWSHLFSLDMLVIVFTLLFIDMFDTIGSIVGVMTKSNMIKPDGKILHIKEAFMADAVATIAGACLGTNTTTTYVESAAGVAQGGRSGLTSFTTAVCFALALLFSPLFLSIPAAATAPVLIVVGLFMLTPIVKIDLNDTLEALPAFVCIIAMPLTYSISDGIMCGQIIYVALALFSGKWRRLTPLMVILVIMFVCKYTFINGYQGHNSEPQPAPTEQAEPQATPTE